MFLPLSHLVSYSPLFTRAENKKDWWKGGIVASISGSIAAFFSYLLTVFFGYLDITFNGKTIL